MVDANGLFVPWFSSSADIENARVTLTVTSPLQSGPPKELRYFAVTHTDTDIPFEFSDIPMP